MKVIILCLLTACAASAQELEPATARGILDKMISVYANCNTYSDTGVHIELHLKSGFARQWSFSTAFVRPSKFRFAYEVIGTDESFEIYQDAVTVKSWFSPRHKVQFHESLDDAVEEAAGVSRLASVRVASMLFGDLRQFKEMQIQNLSHLSLVGEEKLNGRPTYRIKGLDWRQYELTIWVDKETFLLLKTYQIILPATNPSDETTTYKPEINKDIPARKLAFKH